ncbi:MAG: helix-turn-helix domain-containing protein [bacterium]
MNEIRLGDILRERRESLGLTIEEAAKITKLKKSVILALEKGDYKELQEPVYIRGFLKIYASILALDYKDLSPLLDKELRQAGKLEEEKRDKKIKISPLFYALVVVSAIIFIIVIVFIFHWNPANIILKREGQVPKTESIQPRESKPPKEIPNMPPKIETTKVKTSELISPTPTKEKEVSVEIRGLEYSWLRVIVDNKKEFEGFLNNGDFYSWKGKEKIIVRTGNAGGISITVNGRELGILGKKGEVLEREFLPE